jgi:Polyketide cyclase / dehydrase and lipid transport
MRLEELPHIDEHAVAIAAAPERVCEAVLETFRGSGSMAGLLARVLGADPGGRAGPDAVPGFAVTDLDRPHRVVLRGRHRFSEYAIVVRVEPDGEGSRCTLESRGAFPGPHGAVYRLLVVGTGAHVVAVRRLLASIRRRAER